MDDIEKDIGDAKVIHSSVEERMDLAIELLEEGSVALAKNPPDVSTAEAKYTLAESIINENEALIKTFYNQMEEIEKQLEERELEALEDDEDDEGEEWKKGKA